ncbi:MAG TPA: efflux RND transporter periplasmic adaptor subunit, partial [Thermodesulfobacteriota bacterium]
DQARSTLDATKADVDALEARVREQAVQLRYFGVTAPSDGIIGDIPVRVGDYVTTSTVLTTLDQNQALEVNVSVPVERAPELAIGMPVLLVDREGKTIATARIGFISPQVNDATQSVLVKTIVENTTGDLRTEQFVRARIVWQTRKGPVVPAAAVTRLNGQPFAFVAEEDGGALVARQRPIEVGTIIGNDYVVLEGIEPGDRVVVSGIQKLRDGAPLAPEP